MSVKQQLRQVTLRTVTALTLLEVTTHLPTEGRSSQTYHHIFDNFITPLGRRLFTPEDAHHLALEVVRCGLAPRLSREGGQDYNTTVARSSSGENNNAVAGHRIDMSTTIVRSDKHGGSGKSLTFPGGPIGLAAGFDKNGTAISGLFEMGFSFVEIGSVTPQPQDGNAKPRSFRLVEDKGVINRFGFNSLGADVVKGLLQEYRSEFGGRGSELLSNDDTNDKKNKIEDHKEDNTPASAIIMIANKVSWAIGWAWHRIMMTASSPASNQGILGVNLGKNKTSNDEIGDYTTGIRKLGPYADYLVINVSSPNTPGLRSLQQREPLYNLLTSTLKARDEYAPHAPLYVKIAPDLTTAEMEDVAAVLLETGIDGMIVSNTTNTRPESLLSRNKHEVGGLSGAPIKNRSTECIRTMYRLTNGTIPIIGVGGVGSGRDAYDKIKAGASLIQVYSMMVYEGPGVISRIRKELADILVDNGYKSVEEAVGADSEDIYWRKVEERVKQRIEKEERRV